MHLDRKFGLCLSLSEITLLFDLSLSLDRTLAQRKAQRKAKSKVKVAHYTHPFMPVTISAITTTILLPLLVFCSTNILLTIIHLQTIQTLM